MISTIEFGECEVCAVSGLGEVGASGRQANIILRVFRNDRVAISAAALKVCATQVNGDRIEIPKDICRVKKPITWEATTGRESVAQIVDIR
jgi:hypothetical protein